RGGEYYLSRQANPLLGSFTTPLIAQVRLADAKSGSEFEARLNSRGELLGYRLRERRSLTKDKSQQASQTPPQEPPQVENAEALALDRKVADEALQRFLGDRYGKFSFLSASNADKDGRKYTWGASDEGLRVSAEVLVHEGKVGEVWLQSNL